MTDDYANAVALLNAQVGGDTLAQNYAHVLDEIAELDPGDKLRLLASCDTVLNDERVGQDTSTRITAVRILVALLPLSLEAITDLLSRFAGRRDYETHHTLFCYLEWVQEMPKAAILTQSILPLVEAYFLNVPRQTARAVWMAADMMGEHWNEQTAVPLLTKTVKAARYAAGRQGSLLGLEKALARLTAGSNAEAELLKTLRGVSLSDRSGRVRAEAREVLRGWRKKNHRIASEP